MTQLTAEEWTLLRSHCDLKAERGGRRYAPYAFTEQLMNRAEPKKRPIGLCS
jgi:hypothetical protein